MEGDLPSIGGDTSRTRKGFVGDANGHKPADTPFRRSQGARITRGGTGTGSRCVRPFPDPVSTRPTINTPRLDGFRGDQTLRLRRSRFLPSYDI